MFTSFAFVVGLQMLMLENLQRAVLNMTCFGLCVGLINSMISSEQFGLLVFGMVAFTTAVVAAALFLVAVGICGLRFDSFLSCSMPVG